MITYEAEGVKFPNIKKRETSNWIRQVAASYGKKIGDIGYLFVNDDKILETNNKFLGHDYYTDIITFDYTEGKVINGDLMISLDTVFTNADKFGRPYVIVSSFTASCTFVALTTKDLVNVNRWKPQKKRLWLSDNTHHL